MRRERVPKNAKIVKPGGIVEMHLLMPLQVKRVQIVIQVNLVTRMQLPHHATNVNRATTKTTRELQFVYHVFLELTRMNMDLWHASSAYLVNTKIYLAIIRVKNAM